MRRLVVIGAALVVLAGCGRQAAPSSGDSASPGSPSADPAASAAWLLRFDSHLGEDGEATKATYVAFTPSTGQATATAMPTVQAPQTSGAGDALLVDASHTRALVDARPVPADRKAGVVRVHSLTGGAEQAVDVRALTGATGATADWASFDPTQAGVMRVVSGSDVWTVDLAASKAERSGTIPTRAGWIFGGGFDRNTGQPYIEDTGSFDTDPPGNGDDATTPVVRQGGQVLDPLADDEYGDKPDPGCEVSAGFVTADGDTWAFCIQDRTLQAKRLAKDASSWTPVGSPSPAVVPDDGDPVFVLPATR